MFKIKDAWQIVEAPPADEGSWTDTRDGQSYNWKKFGNQTWMLQNFNYGGKNGDWVNAPNAQSEGHAWRFQNTQDYQNYESEQGWSLGAYYTLSSLSWAVPEGWHIPTRDEIATLIDWATTTYGQGASGNITAKDLGLAALMTATSLWGTYLRVPVNKHNLSGMNMSITDSGYNGSSWGQIYTPSGYVFSNGATWWLADDYQGTKKYTLYVSESGQYSSSRVSWTTTQTKPSNANEAYPIRLIRDPVAPKVQPIITEIVTSLGEEGSDNKIATEKAVKDYVDSHSGGGAVQSIADTDSVSLDLDENAELTAEVKISNTSGNQLELISTSGHEGLYVPEPSSLYLGAFDSRNRPQTANTGDYILDTDLGYIIYRYGDAWINATGTVLEGNVDPSVNYPVKWMENPMTSAGDLIVGGANGIPEALAIGTEGQVLTIGTSGLKWSSNSSSSNSPTIYQTGYPNCLYQPAQGNTIHIGCVWGAQLPETIRSFTVWPTTNPYSIASFAMWVGIYDRNADNAPLISSFTWSNDKHPSTNWGDTAATFNFDEPIQIKRNKFYRVVFRYSGGSASWVGVMSPDTSFNEWGTNASPNEYYAPSSYYDFTGSWAVMNKIPWIQLNSFSV